MTSARSENGVGRTGRNTPVSWMEKFGLKLMPEATMSDVVERLPIRQRPGLVSGPNDKWDVRDRALGRSGPFGPSGVSRAEAEAWMADPVRVVVVAVLQDHGEAYGTDSFNSWGTRRCRCGVESPTEAHLADMIAERLAAAGLT